MTQKVNRCRNTILVGKIYDVITPPPDPSSICHHREVENEVEVIEFRLKDGRTEALLRESGDMPRRWMDIDYLRQQLLPRADFPCT